MIQPTIDKCLSTGLISMDMRMGGQIPRGHITELYGNKSSGRSAFATNCIAWCQRAGYQAALIDASDEYDGVRASNFGVSLDDLWYSQKDNLEETFEAVRVASKCCDLIVLDCLASRPGSKETITTSPYLNRRTVSDRIRELSTEIKENNSAVIVVNQSRQSIGHQTHEASRSYYGDLVRLYAGRRVKLTEGPEAKDRHIKVGVYFYAKVMKQFGLTPYTTVKIRMNEHGFDYIGDIVDLALQIRLLERRGPYLMLSIGDEHNLGRTYNDIVGYLNDNPSIWKDLEQAVKRTVFGLTSRTENVRY